MLFGWGPPSASLPLLSALPCPVSGLTQSVLSCAAALPLLCCPAPAAPPCRSPAEVAALIAGVQQCGVNKWEQVRAAHPRELSGRGVEAIRAQWRSMVSELRGLQGL